MAIAFKILVDIINAIAWPLVVIIGLFILRKPLSLFIGELGKRATKFSAFDVSIEFATLPSPPVPWSDPTIYDSSNLIGGYVTSTTVMELFQHIRDIPTWQYLVVDIETGQRWLISRLFLFTVILRYMLNLKCLVFVETQGEYRRRLLGIARPEDVRIILAKKYPWLDEAIVKSWSDQKVPIPIEPLPKGIAESIVNGFMSNDKIQRKEDPMDQEEWQQLGTQEIWEHTKWLTLDRLNRDIRTAFYDREMSQLVDSPDKSAIERNRAVLRRNSPYIALVNDKGEFKGLVDRKSFLEHIATSLGHKTD